MRSQRHFGFTLVELLVVITVIGLLIGLLLPGVQMAREAGRRSTCGNNVKQLALGCLQHESKQGFLPTGGWGAIYGGDPSKGFTNHQPGGWVYNILPYIDQPDLHDNRMDYAPAAAALVSAAGWPNANPNGTPVEVNPTPAQLAAAAQYVGVLRAQTALGVLICPTRRKVAAYPRYTSSNLFTLVNYKPGNIATSGIGAFPFTVIGRTDYAASAGYCDSASGDSFTGISQCGALIQNVGDPFPNNGYSSTFDWSTVAGFNWNTVPGTPVAKSPGTGRTDGVISRASMITMASILDGPANTYLLGERHINGDHYTDGQDRSDMGGWDMGYYYDVIRWTNLHPFQDHAITASASNFSSVFGSAHSSGFNMAFCDGSVRRIAYDIDPDVHRCLGTRNDRNILQSGTNAGKLIDFSEIFK